MSPPHLHVQLLDTNGHPMTPVFACGQLVIVGCMEGTDTDPDDVAIDVNVDGDHVHVRIVPNDENMPRLVPLAVEPLLSNGPFDLTHQRHRQEHPHDRPTP